MKCFPTVYMVYFLSLQNLIFQFWKDKKIWIHENRLGDIFVWRNRKRNCNFSISKEYCFCGITSNLPYFSIRWIINWTKHHLSLYITCKVWFKSLSDRKSSIFNRKLIIRKFRVPVLFCFYSVRWKVHRLLHVFETKKLSIEYLITIPALKMTSNFSMS